MSRQELAELVNAYLLKTAKLTTDLDGNYIGKLERGVHRWPSAGYRNAFRTVLNAATDADLGFYITGRSRTHPSDALFAALAYFLSPIPIPRELPDRCRRPGAADADRPGTVAAVPGRPHWFAGQPVTMLTPNEDATTVHGWT
jgi:hypothetical protein